MAQAKTFTSEEFDALLDFVSKRSYAMRNRMMILISFWSGMRVGEIASLRIEDVVDTAGKVRREIRLEGAQTKGCNEGGLEKSNTSEKELSYDQQFIDAANLGYCELFHFTCAAKRPCDAWKSGGPITKD